MDSFSYQNIVDLVRLAAYEPIRELQKAKYFKISKERDQVYEACASDDPEAKEMPLLDIPYEDIKPRKITMVRGLFSLKILSPQFLHILIIVNRKIFRE